MMLDLDRFVGDFGIRVAINSLDASKLKRLERTNLGDALKDVALSPFQRGFETFGIDDALELISKLSGTASNRINADSVSGSISLKLSGDYDLMDLPSLAEEASNLYESNHYQTTPFRVLDVVSRVTETSQIDQLDQHAVSRIAQGFDDFELGLPIEHLDDDVAFRFRGPGMRGHYPSLLIRNYQQALGPELQNLTLQRLMHDKIEACFGEVGKPNRSWSIRNSLVGSIAFGQGRYAINEGRWYRLDAGFKTSIDQSFQELIEAWEIAPIPFRTIIGQGEAKLQSEDSYNTEAAERLGFLLLDKKLISIPDITRSGFEACDLLDIDGKRLIHVKKGSRKSSVLSHFFKQGANSAQNLKKFPVAWQTITNNLEGDAAIDDATVVRLRQAIADSTRQWTVEYWISDTPRTNGEFNIPFFSKISLRDEASSLRAMEYRVALRFIPQAAPHIP